MEFNKYQSSVESLLLKNYPEEIQEQFWDVVNNVPYIKYMVSNRPTARDLPKDIKGRIIVDITKPHILEDMDYFRPSAIHYQKHGCFTKLRPNPNPNSEYGKWIREEVRRCYEGYVRESDGEWVTGNMYFFINYCQIPMTKLNGDSKKGKRVIEFPEFWEGIYYRFHYIELALNGGIYDLKGGNNGCEISSRGKAHPYSQIVYTPKGCLTWEEIQVGDELFTEKDTITKVIDIPFDDYVDVYKITLKDGRIVYSSAEHIWNVYNKEQNKTITTYELFKQLNNPQHSIYRIPANKGVSWSEKKVPIDPYTIGLLLGRGTINMLNMHEAFQYVSSEEDYYVYKKLIPYNIHKYNTSGYFQIEFPIKKARVILKELQLYKKSYKELFIPDIYLYNSRKNRLNLLRGLMDSKGFVDYKRIPVISVISKTLADNILLLVRSLGYNSSLYIRENDYLIRIYSDARIFNLDRKLFMIDKSPYLINNSNHTAIVSVEYSHKERCKCVTVDNPTNLYLVGDFITTHNSKSLTMAAIMAKYFVLGESSEVNRAVKCLATAYQKQYLISDGILSKFQSYIDFLALNTQFPSKRLKSSLLEMAWKMGYMDIDTGTQKGTLNEVLGVSAKDDISKVRGKRMHFIVVEEFGSFKNVLSLYNIMLPSVLEGNISFGFMYLIGTAGDDDSDFRGALEIVYNPKGYNMYALPNVWDKEGLSRKYITFFFPGYINRKGCYDKDGNSDVTKALLEILADRYRVKYNSSDVNSITKIIAEIPITPLEAILRTRGNMFPVTQLNERLNEIDANPNMYDDVYVGTLVMSPNGKVEFKPTNDTPIREFPLKDNLAHGAIEIFQMPELDNKGKVYSDRYILGNDPVDHDLAESLSLTSTFVLDLWTDKIVAEYTGRQDFADDNFELVRLLCLFYNGKCLYESNKKGLFAYFSRMSCLHLLADVPEYLKDKQLIKLIGYGNQSKGVNATAPINNFANNLIRDWLLKPVPTIVKEDGLDKEITVPNLYFIKNRALLKELILFNGDINVDRVRSLGMVMLYREEKIILYLGEVKKNSTKDLNAPEYDEFFSENFDLKFNQEEVFIQ